MDKTSKILAIIVTVVIISLVGSVSSVDGSVYSTIAEAINAFAQGQGELINQTSVSLSQNDRLIQQNDIMIEQNSKIIELLMNDRNIFLKGESTRYMFVEYVGNNQCLTYDKLLDYTSTNSCPFSTANQFNEYLYHQESPIRE